MAETTAVEYDVVVVGAGMAGSALALALAGQGLSIALVEARPAGGQAARGTGVDAFDARVSALTPRSQRLFTRLGVWPAIVAGGACAYRHMTVWDAEGTGSIEFDCAEVGAPVLGHIVENRVIVDALLEAVAGCRDIDFLNPARVAACERKDTQGLELRLEDGRRLGAALLVAADGALSPLREMLDFDTREWDYGHDAIVATVQTARPHAATAWQRFLSTGPLAFLPLAGTADAHYCSIVWSAERDRAEDLAGLDDDAFRRELTAAFEARLGEVLAVSKRHRFPLRQRHAVDYVQPGVALVGDAAHTIHPLAGQGINLGLADVLVLAEEILAARARGQAPGELAVLRRYQRRRKGENLAMMAAMDGFKRLFGQRALAVRWLRNAGLRAVGRLAPLKQQLMRHAMGLQD
jgi:2-octaprenylphenol hydroxylase